MATLSDILVKLSLDMKDFNKGLANVQTKTKDIGKSLGKTGKSLTTKVTAPLALLGGAVIKTGAQYEQSMSKVEALTGANGKQMEQLSKKAGELGKSTKFSASEAADGMAFLGMAGYSTDQILASMDGTLALAAASGMDLASTADIATNIMSGFGLEADQTGRMADVLAKASTNANTTVEQLGQAMVSLAPNAKALGWELEDTTSAVMTMSNAGIQGEAAGRAFATSLNRLAAPVGRGAKVIEELGLEFFNLDGSMKTLPEIIDEMNRGFDGMTDQQKAAALSAISGQEAYKHWAVLLEDGSEALANNADMLRDSGGAAEELAAIMNDNLIGKWDMFKSALSGVAIEIYNMMLPSLESLVEKATELVGKWDTLDDSTKKNIITFAGVAAAIGPILLGLAGLVQTIAFVVGAFMKVVSAVGFVINIFSKLSKVFTLVRFLPLILTPAGLIIAAIAAIIAIGVLVWKNWDTIKAKAIQIWSALSSKASEIFGNIVQWIKDSWTKAKESTTNILTSVKDWIVGVWDSIVNSVKTFGSNVLQFFSDAWTSVKESTVSIFNSIVDFFKTWVVGLLAWTPIGLFVGFIVKNWDTIKETTMIIFDMIKQLIVLAFTLVKNLVMPIVNGFVKLVKAGWTLLKTVTSTVFNAVYKVISSVFQKVKSIVMPIVTFLLNYIKGKWNTIKSVTLSVFNAVKDAIMTRFNQAKAVVTTIATAIWSVIKSKFNQVKSVVTTIFSAVYNAIRNKFNQAKAIVTSIASAIWSVISSKFNQVKSVVTTIFSAVYNVIRNKFNSVKSTVSSAVSTVYNKVKSKFDAIKSKMTKPIEDAKNTISKAVDKIKGFFTNMKLTIPKPKLPKISVTKGSKSIAGVEIPFPKFSVDWNAKGNIFNGASILGGGQGVGEAGAEVVMPIQHKRYMQPFSNAVAEQLNDMKDDRGGGVVNHIEVAELVVREEADIDKVAQKLHDLQKRDKRTRGR